MYTPAYSFTFVNGTMKTARPERINKEELEQIIEECQDELRYIEEITLDTHL